MVNGIGRLARRKARQSDENLLAQIQDLLPDIDATDLAAALRLISNPKFVHGVSAERIHGELSDQVQGQRDVIVSLAKALNDSRNQIESLEAMYFDLNSKYQSVKHKRELLESAANTDRLTSALNRQGLDNFFSLLVQENKEGVEDHATEVVFIAIDLDKFKPLNDNQGYAAGDDALVQVAQLLATIEANGHKVKVGRPGGDEFVVAILLSRSIDPLYSEIEQRYEELLASGEKVPADLMFQVMEERDRKRNFVDRRDPNKTALTYIEPIVAPQLETLLDGLLVNKKPPVFIDPEHPELGIDPNGEVEMVPAGIGLTYHCAYSQTREVGEMRTALAEAFAGIHDKKVAKNIEMQKQFDQALSGEYELVTFLSSKPVGMTESEYCQVLMNMEFIGLTTSKDRQATLGHLYTDEQKQSALSVAKSLYMSGLNDAFEFVMSSMHGLDPVSKANKINPTAPTIR